MKAFDFLETRYRSIIVSWVLISVGLVAIIIGNQVSIKNVTWLGINVGNNISNLGSLVGIIGLMQWTYDAFSRRKFFEEIITSVSGTRAIYDLGIVDAQERSSEANLHDEIVSANTLVLLFSHSKRFIDRYHDALVERTNAKKLTTVYINHKDSNAVNYYISCGRGKAYLQESIDEFIRVMRSIDSSKLLIEIKLIDVVPKYSLAKVDKCAFFIFATSSEGQTTVPLLACRRDTALWRFITEDIAHIDQNHVKEIA